MRLRDPTDGYMDEVHSLRNLYGADLSMLTVENLTNNYCGLGYTMNANGLQIDFEQYAFSVVRLDCLSYYAPAHEMGHNMGAQHDRYVCEADNTGAYEYSHGYVYTPDRWRTIMAYHNECDDSGLYYEQIPFWSNPYVNYDGVPTGVSEFDIDSADNAKTLNNTAYIVANFRESVSAITTTSIPATTTSIPVTTTSIPVTTSINPITNTSIGYDCPPDSPIDCGNGWCCNTDYPICGSGKNENMCFSEWNQNPSCPMSLLYGDRSSETELLRYLRDNVLSQTQEGQEIIRLYYQWGPVLVRAMEEDGDFKEDVKAMVDELLPMLRGKVE